MSGGAKPNFDQALERLDDYSRGALDETAARDFEADLFERALAGSAPELAFRDGLGAAFRAMSARGTIDLWLTSAGVERLKSETRLRVLVWTFDFENPAAPVIPEDTDVFVAKIPFDLRGVRRIEAEVFSPEGRLLKTMPDIAFDPSDQAIYACCEPELARTAASRASTLTRVWAIEDNGRRHLADLPSFGG